MVIVSGPAGSGKSAISKDVVSLFSSDHFVFGFRVEEFAQPHIDATLHTGQIPTRSVTLAAILAAQGRKLVLIESVERLLEKTTRDSFSDLMAMVAADRSLCILLTCRDYSIEQVRVSFLQPASISHTVVSVPPLDDIELKEVEVALPTLAIPLKNPALRNILRNPYFLDKAVEISWSMERSIPECEREFRALFWRQIIRADQNAPAGMARRREEMFQEIAVRRARALTAFVLCNDLDPSVIKVLRNDSLIILSTENPLLVATAHDVLEDWSILHWLEEQHLTAEGSFRDLSSTIGAHPAIRRAYRKWLAELVDLGPSAADRLFIAAISATGTSAQFRDDSIVSLLKAPSSSDFLARHEALLLGKEMAILKRIIHLLRVACVKMADWMKGHQSHGSISNVPDGPAWATILRLVFKSISNFTSRDRPLLLCLIEDACRSVSWWAPEIDGAEFVIGIGHWLLPGYDHYRSDDSRKRVLQVIAKIPKADPVRFEHVLRGEKKEERQRNRITDDFREIIFCGFDGMAAARDFPALIVSVAKEFLLVSEAELRRNHHSRDSLDLGIYFGIREDLRHDFFPASAFRGPWFHLLRYHPRIGLDFFVYIFNYSVDWYVHPRAHDPLEPAWEIELTFADGTKRKQWGNPRFWNLYRGTSVGPYVLQSLLMALENWLLEFASNNPDHLDAILLDILRRSESAMLTAGVHSPGGVESSDPVEPGDPAGCPDARGWRFSSGDGREFPASWGQNRSVGGPAHLGRQSRISPAHSLPRAWRRLAYGRPVLDDEQFHLLSPGEKLVAAFPWQIPGDGGSRLSGWASRGPLGSGMGGLLQAGNPGSTEGSRLPGPLYPPHGDLRSLDSQPTRRPSHIRIPGSPSRETTHDDPARYGIPAAVSAARSSARLPSSATLGIASSLITCRPAAASVNPVAEGRPIASGNSNTNAAPDRLSGLRKSPHASGRSHLSLASPAEGQSSGRLNGIGQNRLRTLRHRTNKGFSPLPLG